MTKKPRRSPESKKSTSKTPKRRVTPIKTAPESGDGLEIEEASRRAARPFLVVGVGASAGGMEAFNVLLKKLSADIPAAFVFVSHLDPKVESSLDEIFRRNTKLRVQMVHEPTSIEPGNVYVLPSNRQIRVSGGILRTEPRKGADGYRPIDVFFHSLALDQANLAVGVLLSGSGTDGIAGLEEIKAEGGITFAQTEASATFALLPAGALSSGCVDFVLAPENIAFEIDRIARHPVFTRPRKAGEPDHEPQSELHRIFALLRTLNGVDFSYYKPSTLRRRIFRRMVLRKLTRLQDYTEYLQKNPAEVDLLFHDLLINVTSFFRDPSVFTALRKKLFPKFLKRRPNDAVRLWVPGCSTGEEVYSLAIALFEFFGKNPDGRSIQIFATDISETALARARAGIYAATITSQVSPERLRRFFTKLDDGQYRIAKALRDSCVFARQNLIEDPPFSKLDLISCRNVLIYLGPLLQKKVIPIFHYALKPGGHLLLGGSETIGAFAELFALVDKKHKVYAKRDLAIRPDLDFLPKRSGGEIAEPKAAPATVTVPGPEAAQTFELARQVDRLLLAQFAPAGVVINSRMDALQFRGQTGAYLEHPPGDASLNLLKLVRADLLADVRATITRAMKSDRAVRKDGIEYTYLGKRHVVNIEVVPFKSGGSAERFLVVLFKEAAPDGTAKTPRTIAGSSAESRQEIGRLRDELHSTKESLQAIIEEQEATNEELKSANEEIQSSNEELQSTNEELETAKEELQSTNEELTTLNEELQGRNLELTQLNNDLGNLLSSVSMPILMLGGDLSIRRFTPLAERFFNLIPSDVGRRISDINPNIQINNLAGFVMEVIDTLRTQEHEVQDREGRWYSLRIRPYRTSDNKIDGAVVMLVDVDEFKQGLTEFMAVVDQPVVTLRGDLRVQYANDAFHRAFHTSAQQVHNKLIYELQNGAWDFHALRNLLEAELPEKNAVAQARIEHDFGPGGRKTLLMNARRFFQRSKGSQITLVAFRDIGEGSEKASP